MNDKLIGAIDRVKLLAGIDKALKLVCALCKPKGTKGSREWIMSIPARPDYDPDIVIGDALMAAQKYIQGEWLPIDPENLPPPRPEGYWVGYEDEMIGGKTFWEFYLTYDEPERWADIVLPITHYHTGPGAPPEPKEEK